MTDVYLYIIDILRESKQLPLSSSIPLAQDAHPGDVVNAVAILSSHDSAFIRGAFQPRSHTRTKMIRLMGVQLARTEAGGIIRHYSVQRNGHRIRNDIDCILRDYSRIILVLG